MHNRKISDKKYYLKNKRKILKHQARYYQKNRENSISNANKYYKKNKFKIKKTWKKYYKKNKNKIQKYQQQYYRKNKKKIDIRNQIYAKNHPKIVLKSKLKYKRNRPDYIIWNSLNQRYKNTSKLKIVRIEFLNWYNKTIKICQYCNISEKNWAKSKDSMTKHYKKLQIDRKDNNKGYQIDNICLACPRCNATKSDYFTYKQMLKIGRMINEAR